MLTRRTMLRALGLGAPAAAVAACLPAVAGSEPAGAERTSLVFEAGQFVVGRAGVPPFNVASLSAISGNMGQITGGLLLSRDGASYVNLATGVAVYRS